MTTYRPIHDRVLLVREDRPTTSQSGLILSTNTTKSEYATVVAVGPGIENAHGVFIPTSVREGDRVVLGSTSSDGRGAYVFFDNDKEYVIVRESDIVAVLQA